MCIGKEGNRLNSGREFRGNTRHIYVRRVWGHYVSRNVEKLIKTIKILSIVGFIHLASACGGSESSNQSIADIPASSETITSDSQEPPANEDSTDAAIEPVTVNGNDASELEPEPEPESTPEKITEKPRPEYHPQVPASGRWSELIQWPHIPVHIANLPDGKLLSWSSYLPETWDSSPGNYTVSGVFDPVTRTFQKTDNDRHDMFCAGITLLEDGTVLATGGNKSPVRTNSSRFDIRSLEWNASAPMNSPRWYGTNVVLASGDVFTTFALGAEEIGEIYSPLNNTWTNLPGTNMTTLSVEQNIIHAETGDPWSAQWYAYMHVTPDGKVFHPGPTKTMHLFSTEAGGMTEDLGPSPFTRKHLQFGTSTSYAPGKLLITGGADPRQTDVSTNEAMIVDLTSATPTPRTIKPMHETRTFHDAVVMANGEVLIVGGNGNGRVFNDFDTRLDSEIFNPQSEDWRLAPAISIPRNYHSVAILMKDARVLSGGGGLCGYGCEVNHANAEIYTPGYLLNTDGTLAQRPTITEITQTAFPGDDISLTADSEVFHITMTRLSGTTHSINTDQRFLKVDFSLHEDGYSLHLEDNPNVLIPGNYWVFAFNAQGNPSVGETLQIKVLENK